MHNYTRATTCALSTLHYVSLSIVLNPYLYSDSFTCYPLSFLGRRKSAGLPKLLRTPTGLSTARTVAIVPVFMRRLNSIQTGVEEIKILDPAVSLIAPYLNLASASPRLASYYLHQERRSASFIAFGWSLKLLGLYKVNITQACFQLNILLLPLGAKLN